MGETGSRNGMSIREEEEEKAWKQRRMAWMVYYTASHGGENKTVWFIFGTLLKSQIQDREIDHLFLPDVGNDTHGSLCLLPSPPLLHLSV